MGDFNKIYDKYNLILRNFATMNSNINDIKKAIINEGKLDIRFDSSKFVGICKEYSDSLNFIIEYFVKNFYEISSVLGRVAQGDLSQKITVDAKGEVLELKNTINTMVDQLSQFALEVTRVAKESGRNRVIQND